MNNFRKEHVQAGGGLQPLAATLGVRYQAIQAWLKRGSVPAERVIAIERATGVSRYALRPDIYGDPPEQRAA